MTEKQKQKRRDYVDSNISALLNRLTRYMFEKSNMEKYGHKWGECLGYDKHLVTEVRNKIIQSLEDRSLITNEEEFYPPEYDMFGQKKL